MSATLSHYNDYENKLKLNVVNVCFCLFQKFNIEIEVTNSSIEITESVASKKGSLQIPGDFHGHFISLIIKDSGR